MRLLGARLHAILLVALVSTSVALVVGPGAAHPPPEPEHGFNETTYAPLWAGDTDASTETDLTDRLGEDSEAIEELAGMTDIAFDQPPRAVERWNRADHQTVPETGASRSSAPTGTRLANGRYVADAHASIFAVQPSTRLLVSDERQPLYVAPDGEVLGVVDYRVVVPEDTRSRDRQVTWKLETHEITKTRLLVDGDLEAQGSGSNTPVLAYDELDDNRAFTHILRFEAEITATLERRVRECTKRVQIEPAPGVESTGTTCANWEVTVTHPSETVTVGDRRDVTVQRFAVTGQVATYPEGDLGLSTALKQPWRSYTTPAGELQGGWRFYSARLTEWDTLQTRGGDGNTTSHSPAHPLQVYAYPVANPAAYHRAANVTILSMAGEQWSAPTLPPTVELDSVTGSYNTTADVTMRLHTSDHDLSQMTVNGIVRGTSTTLSPRRFTNVSLFPSNLTLDVLDTSEGTTTVQVALRDNASGAPISTERRQGYVVVNGQRLNTTADGTANLTVSSSTTAFEARYVPGEWWRGESTYVGDTAIIAERTTVLSLLETLFRIGIPIGMLLVAIFLIDRITGWRIWPPWGPHR